MTNFNLLSWHKSHHLKASRITLFLSCAHKKWFQMSRPRHDKQDWGCVGSKWAATDREAAELSLYSILVSDSFLPHNTALRSLCAYECTHLRTHIRHTLLYACRVSWKPIQPLSVTHTYVPHPDRMKNAFSKLSARSLRLIPSYYPLSSSHRHNLSALNIYFLSSSSSIMLRCLVNLVLLYATDTQLVVGVRTRPNKKRLGLLQTEVVKGNRMGFTGQQGLSYS